MLFGIAMGLGEFQLEASGHLKCVINLIFFPSQIYYFPISKLSFVPIVDVECTCTLNIINISSIIIMKYFKSLSLNKYWQSA